MIYDQLTQADAYRGVLPAFGAVLDALTGQDLIQLPTGRSVLLPDQADLIIDRYTPSSDRAIVWETHERFADLQLMLIGEERFGWLPRSAAPPVKTPYDPERDACFYQEPGAPHRPVPSYLALVPGMFALFLPTDVHAPGLCPATAPPHPVTKAVVKIRLDS
ncbi:MAG: YhcH/YjgK/YiaL family protein [Phycisphaerales bacterium JB063]